MRYDKPYQSSDLRLFIIKDLSLYYDFMLYELLHGVGGRKLSARLRSGKRAQFLVFTIHTSQQCPKI